MVPGAARKKPWRIAVTRLRIAFTFLTFGLLFLYLATGSRAIFRVELLSFLTLSALMLVHKVMDQPEVLKPTEDELLRMKVLAAAYAELEAIDAVAAGDFQKTEEPKKLTADPAKLRQMREFQEHREYFDARMLVDYWAKNPHPEGKFRLAYLSNTINNTIETWRDGQLVDVQPIAVATYHPGRSIETYTGVRSGGGASC